MAHSLAVEHGCTSILGLVILGLIGWGSWRFGYVRFFTLPPGHVVLGLAVVDAIGLAFWS